MRRTGERLTLDAGLGQHRVDGARVPFETVVEQRQPAVAVTETPEQGRHALDGPPIQSGVSLWAALKAAPRSR